MKRTFQQSWSYCRSIWPPFGNWTFSHPTIGSRLKKSKVRRVPLALLLLPLIVASENPLLQKFPTPELSVPFEICRYSLRSIHTVWNLSRAYQNVNIFCRLSTFESCVDSLKAVWAVLLSFLCAKTFQTQHITLFGSVQIQHIPVAILTIRLHFAMACVV